MFLSVIIPVYNAEAYLGECLSSLLGQDLPGEEYEIVCVNDGSGDGSLALLRSFAETHSNIIVIDQENSGVTTARNAGLAAAKGDYIWFIDADDFVRPNCFARLKALADPNLCDRVVFGAYRFTDTLTEEEREKSRKNALPVNTPWYDAVVWRCILRREFLLRHALTFRYPELTHGEDGLFMYEVTLCDPATTELNEVLYFYREHSGSAETTVSPENRLRKLRSYIRICTILRKTAGERESGANKLMSFLWMALYESLQLPQPQKQQALDQLKKEGLFPFQRPAGCTLTRSYMTDREDMVGKVFDKVYLNLHRPWGYAAMGLLLKLK